MEIFSFIYSWLVDMYGSDLDQFLTNSTSAEGMNYFTIGIVVVLVSLVLPALYYKAIDKPSWNHWWCWLLTLVLTSVINFIYASQTTLQNLYDGYMDVVDESTGDMVTYVTENNCYMFGVATVILTVIAFCVFSYILHFFSVNVKYSPFSK